MGVVLLVPGLILDLAGSDWFSGAQTVGVILIITGAVMILVQIAMIWGTMSWVNKINK